MKSNTLQKHDYTLVKGTYKASEAQEILMSLITKKINFHELRNLGHHENYGEPDPASVKRIEELKKQRDHLLSVIQEAQENNKSIHIDSKITVQVQD